MTERPVRAPRRASLVIVSNGFGEDLIGARLGAELLRQRPSLDVRALPTVTDGATYLRASIPVLGPASPLPSGGLTLHSWSAFMGDLRGGLLSITARQLRALVALRSDVVVVVGDIYALALGSLVRGALRVQFQPLVSSWISDGADGPPNRFFMERISYPERALMRHTAARVYARDARTAADLVRRGVPHAVFLGNPIVDAVRGAPMPVLDGYGAVVALLPGTRDYAGAALTAMLAALRRVPRVHGVVAWAGAELPEIPEWHRVVGSGDAGLIARYVRPDTSVDVFEGRFGDVLASADAVIGTTGTANEQAAALGLPVVTFPLAPSFTPAFVRNQKRLLGPALTVVTPSDEAIADAVTRALEDPDVAAAARRTGPERIGPPGGTARIVRDILECADARGAWTE